MSYVSQEMKKSLAPQIKDVLKKYDMKGTIAIRNHSVLVVNIKSGALDLIGQANRDNEAKRRYNDREFAIKDNYQANPYRAHESEDENVSGFFNELIKAMKGSFWYDDSNVQTDYFDTAYYLNINVGSFDKPYQYTG